jgi:hypothetical protein
MKPYEIFIEMKKLPKGYIIDNPYGLVETDFTISKNVLSVLQADSDLVFFTRLSIKHLAEKEIDGDHIFKTIQLILNDPEKIHIGNFSNRFLISKNVLFQTGPKPHVVVVEINKKNQ